MNIKWINGKPYAVDEDGEMREATWYELEQEGYVD